MKKYYCYNKMVYGKPNQWGVRIPLYKTYCTVKKPTEIIEAGEIDIYVISAVDRKEAIEKFKNGDAKNLNSFYYTDVEATVKKLFPCGDTFETMVALEENFNKRGLISQRLLYGERLTKQDIYSVMIAYVRHNHTEYDAAKQKGDHFREFYNDHDATKRILGIDELHYYPHG